MHEIQYNKIIKFTQLENNNSDPAKKMKRRSSVDGLQGKNKKALKEDLAIVSSCSISSTYVFL